MILQWQRQTLSNRWFALYDEFHASILPCIRIGDDRDYDRYGVLAGEEVRPDILKMNRIIEKPGKENAPSSFASVGGFLFTPDVLEYLERGLAGLTEGQEFYVSDSLIQPMLADGKAFYGAITQNGQRYDTGDKLEYLKTVFDFGLKHEELGPELRAYLENRLKD
ncbi:MAG: sugar phosphate nucleotidyltransferase [Candidatus Saccharibacteria bacterium]